MFITLYGINNIGKSTQAKMLVEHYLQKGTQAEYMKYPVYDIEPTGPYINHLIRDPDAPKVTPEELQMWYALNRFQAQPILAEKQARGMTIIAEDYTGTGIAWGMAYGVDKKWLIEINEPLMNEDLSILLDGDRFLEAREQNHKHETDDDLTRRCRHTHLELAHDLGWHIVQANQSTEKVFEDILSVIKPTHHP